MVRFGARTGTRDDEELFCGCRVSNIDGCCGDPWSIHPFHLAILCTLSNRRSNRWVYGIIVLILLLMLGYGAHLCHDSPWLGLGLPLASALLLYIFWRSMIQTLWYQGIYWRETYYPLR